MKIGFVGGGSGGHFYPIIAVAQRIHEYVQTEKLLEPELYYFAPNQYDKKSLSETNIIFVQIPAGKIRKYSSIKNFFDLFKTGWGILVALWRVLTVFPDIFFSTGSYVSFPVLLAARIFGIPVIIHEADAIPGRANFWAASFAKKIAISFPQAKQHFENRISSKKLDGASGKIALTGQPIRKELLTTIDRGAREYLNLEEKTPLILILGGSQGSQILNETIIDILPNLLEQYQIIHQTGPEKLEESEKLAHVYLEKNEYRARYKPFGFLNVLALRMAGGAADLIISRAGANTLFEIAAWGKPSIVIPIAEKVSHNQRDNAFTFARAGAANVIEEQNLSPHLLVSEIHRLMDNQQKRTEIGMAAKTFAKTDAAQKIAREILDLALEHEQ